VSMTLTLQEPKSQSSNIGAIGQNSPNTMVPSVISSRVRLAGLILRTLFIGVLVALTLKVSWPQSETIWLTYRTAGDFVRLTLGIVVCVWMLIQVFVPPKDAEGYRTWIYLGCVAVPFTLIAAVASW
jgi:hypothetical protein